MSLSRRQFFRRFWNTEDKTAAQRLARYETLESDARRYFLPYDFCLTPDQETELFSNLRSILEPLSNEELFSPSIIQKIETLMEERIRPWRDANWSAERAAHAREVRQAALNYVPTFLTQQATRQTVDQLKTRLGASTPEELEDTLRDRVRDWAQGLSDEDLTHYDVVTVKDLVFAQLRSWC
jgi:hypothetical protein